MRTTRTLTPGLLTALLTALAAGVVAAGPQPPPRGATEELLPGARRLPDFPHKVFRVPALLVTQKGPRLLVWVDKSDPAPVTRPYAPMPKPPEFDLVFWDSVAGKELHQMSSAKETAPPSPVAPAVMPYAFLLPGLLGSLDLSPDGKLLAHVSVRHQQIPGKLVHERQAQVKLYDLSTRKWRLALPATYKGENGPHVLFAPDGALVILKDATCTVQGPGKAKARRSFRLLRSRWYANNPLYYAIRDAALTPDGSRLAVAADGWVSVYDLGTGKKVLQAARAAPEDKTGRGIGRNTERAALAFAAAQDEPRLLAVETVTGAPKSFVLARLFDLKANKEVGRRVLAEQATKPGAFNQGLPLWGPAHAYFTAKGEPRVLFDGKVFDGASGKALHRFDPGVALLVPRDGKCLVRLTRPKGEEPKMGVEIWSLENAR
jgi:hypothetical protein